MHGLTAHQLHGQHYHPEQVTELEQAIEQATPSRPIADTLAERLIADALITYIAHQPDGQITFHYRLIELDRATIPADTLAGKLARYTDLHRHLQEGEAKHAQPGRRRLYPVLPDVHCVLTAAPRASLQRRAQTVLALLANDPRPQAAPGLRISLTLLEDLQRHGPWAAIWRTPRDPASTVDWLGHARR